MLISFSTIGRNIRNARLSANLTQECLAEQLKISSLHFGRLERGERPISLEMLAEIAQALHVSLYALLDGCVTGEELNLRGNDSPDALGRMVANLAAGCTDRTRELILKVCQLIAESDKL